MPYLLPTFKAVVDEIGESVLGPAYAQLFNSTVTSGDTPRYSLKKRPGQELKGEPIAIAHAGLQVRFCTYFTPKDQYLKEIGFSGQFMFEVAKRYPHLTNYYWGQGKGRGLANGQLIVRDEHKIGNPTLTKIFIDEPHSETVLSLISFTDAEEARAHAKAWLRMYFELVLTGFKMVNSR